MLEIFTLGGTGKTPMSYRAIFNFKEVLKKNPAFIRKKYDSFQDEANLQKKVRDQFIKIKKELIAINEAITRKMQCCYS